MRRLLVCVLLAACGEDAAPVPTGTVLAGDQLMPWGIAIDETSIYWTTLGQGAGPAQVLKMPKTGGTPTVLADGQQLPLEIAVDPDSVYWTTLHGTVWRVAKSGGSPTVLADSQIYPLAIVVDATDVYWTNYRGGSIARVARTGGAVTEVVTGQMLPNSLATDDHAIYWTSGDAVMRAAKSDFAPVAMATGQDHPSAVQIDAQTLYWVNRGQPARGSVMAMPLTGGAPSPIATDQAVPDDLAVTSTIYWADWGEDGYDGSIARAAHGSIEIVAGRQAHPVAVVADASGVYWTNAGACHEDQTTHIVYCDSGAVMTSAR